MNFQIEIDISNEFNKLTIKGNDRKNDGVNDETLSLFKS